MLSYERRSGMSHIQFYAVFFCRFKVLATNSKSSLSWSWVVGGWWTNSHLGFSRQDEPYLPVANVEFLRVAIENVFPAGIAGDECVPAVVQYTILAIYAV
jgi:hypothetical protein